MESAKMICFAFLGLWCLCQAKASEDNVVTVTSILSRPYLYLSESNSTVFEGFIADFVSQLATITGFDYRIVLVKDGKYGNKRMDGTWNGMIGELTRLEADMAVAPLTITSMRERVVDFSHPFLMFGLRMLMQKSSTSHVKNWEDLANDDNVTAGTLDSGSTQNFFRTSKVPLYERIWSKMANAEPLPFVRTTEEGVNRVRESPDYVFISESPILTYYAEKAPCDLTVTGDYLSMRGYGIATPLGSPYRERINLAVLELQEVGEIEKLYKKWFVDKGDCSANEK